MKKVVKFGGSSLADSSQFKKVRSIIEQDPERAFVVVSAPGKRHSQDHKITDLLLMSHQLSSHDLNFEEVFELIESRYTEICSDLDLSIDINPILSEVKENISKGASRDYVASRGEYINGLLLADYLGIDFIDASEIIRFNDNGVFDDDKSEELISEKLKDVERAVIPGFYGANRHGQIITFSRGGSDVTGSIVANGVEASIYENWTDVSGFLMADPKIQEDAKPMGLVTYKELRELSYMGAPVLHEEAIFPVRKKGISIQIKNTNEPEAPGTMIVHDDFDQIKQGSITGISGKKGFTVISVEKTLMNVEKGFIRKLISIFEANDISIEHIPSSIDSISIIVADSEIKDKEKKIVEEIKIYCNPDTVNVYPGMALLTVVGRGMVKTKGTSAKIFTALYEAGVNVRMITQGSSELNIIIGIETRDFEKAVRAIYGAFK
ncbi:aspartate kinase [Microaceticoccus formicicus]|uniref:aspartate kinase n=1 Tax=Microaceticoccus formicicus TaxID=3118105 RepID=UPI003CD03948|nr:aspartate kinase [Peptoniphilaceae bacterium AMB_02]